MIASGLLERFDLALASTKGMSNTSARALIDEMAGRVPDFRVFTVADFDIAGQSIRHTLTNDTVRYQFRNEINVTHLGIDWNQAQELHEAGRSEPAPGDDLRKRAGLLEERGLEEDAIEFLTGGNPMRVEVNALRPAEFIKMLRSKLSKHCGAKLIPPDEVLADAFQDLTIRERVRAYEADLRSEPEPKLLEGLMVSVCDALKANPDQSWDYAVLGIIETGGGTEST